MRFPWPSLSYGRLVGRIAQCLRPARPRRQRRRRPDVRLGLECLEARLAPATLTVTDGADPATTPGTLGYVLANATANDVIDFDPSVRSITLSGGLTIGTNVTITNDQGSGPVTIDASGTGGNAFTVNGVTATLTGLTIAHGNIDNSGTLKVNNCTISSSRLSGILNEIGATLTVNNCTFSGDSSGEAGGGIFLAHGSAATVANSTFFGNSAAAGGGIGIDRGSTLTVSDCTFSGNIGGGIENSGGTATLTGDIVAGNFDPSGVSPDDISGDNVDPSSNHNLIGDASSSGGLTDGQNGNQVGVVLADVHLAPLGDYGGPTPTMALLPHSRAIGKGVTPTTDGTDQRGVDRPAGTPSDVGAVQYEALVVNTVDGPVVPGVLSLPQAVNLANVRSEPIVFDPTVFATHQTIHLGPIHGLTLTNTKALMYIEGPSAGVTLDLGDFGGVLNTFATGAFVFGGVTAELSNLTITNATVDPDHSPTLPAGIDNAGTLTLRNCTFSGNRGTSSGAIENTGTLTVRNCTFDGNSVTVGFPGTGGGGIRNEGAMTVSNSTFSGSRNFSGGIFNEGTATVSNSTFSGNDGGGILNHGTLTVNNSTVFGNFHGAGIANSGTATLTGDIVADNTTLIADNTGYYDITVARDIEGGVDPSSSDNLIGDAASSGGLTNNDPNGNQVGVSLADIGLAPLGNYGGPTRTMALLPGSPALGRGVTETVPTTDQRGVARPVGTPSDVGAFQSGGTNSVTLTSLSTTSASEGSAAFTLTLTGANFVSQSVVQWNGAALPTTFVSGAQLQAAVPAADLSEEGTVGVTVVNPDGTSAPHTFTISDRAPVVKVFAHLHAAAGIAFSRIVASFTDPSGAENPGNYKAVIDWGDPGAPGADSTGTVAFSNGVFLVSGSHTYTQDGAFTLSVTVQDDGTTASPGASASDSKAITVVNTVFGRNLIKNGDAETAATGGATGQVPDWTTTGGFSVVQYGAGVGFPSASDPGPADRAQNFFAGGQNNTRSSAEQIIDVSSGAAVIDAGGATFNLSAYLGGFAALDDNAVLTVKFEDQTGAVLSTAAVGPVLAADRSAQTGLLQRGLTGDLPVGTRKIDVTLQMTGTLPAYNHAYADDLSLVLHEGPILALLKHPGTLTDGLDLLLNSLQTALDNSVLGKDYPLVGTHLPDVANFVAMLADPNLEGSLGGVEVANDPVALVRNTLLDFLGPNGLNLLVDANGNAPAAGLSPDQLLDALVPVTLDQNHVEFNVHLHKAPAPTAAPLNYDIGLPALKLSVPDTAVNVNLGWDFRLGFGVNLTDGFYIDTAAKDGQGNAVPELGIHVDATTNAVNTTGRLGHLRVDVAAPAPNSPPFSGDFAVDLVTAGDRLTANAVKFNRIDVNQVLHPTLTAAAHVDLGLTTDFFGANFPQIKADFHMDWVFDPHALSPQDQGLAGAAPHIVFNDIRLDLGSFLSKFVSPIVTEIDNVLKPIQPLVDFLEKPLPVISQFYGYSDADVQAGKGVKLLDLVTQLGVYGDWSTAQAFLDAADAVLHMPANIPGHPPDLQIHFGSFDLGAFDVRSQPDLNNAQPNPTDTPPSVDSQVAGSSAKTFFDSLETTPGFEFPFLNDRTSLFKVLIGQTVDLFQFTMPHFAADFPFDAQFPVFGPEVPVDAVISGRIKIDLDFKFGYDTTGLEELLSALDANQNLDAATIAADVFDGFFIDTKATKAQFRADLLAGASLNAGIGSAELEGGLFADVLLTLSTRDPQGLLRWKEALATIDSDPLKLFNASGKLTFHLVGQVNLFGNQGQPQDLVPPQTIVDFGGSGGDFPPPASNVSTRITDGAGATVGYLTSPPNTTTIAQTFTPPADNPPPANDVFPFGYVTFTQTGFAPAGSTTGTTVVTISLSEVIPDPNNPPKAVDSYWKYGPTADTVNPDGSHPAHWYKFDYNPATGIGATVKSVMHTYGPGKGPPRSGGSLDDPLTIRYTTITLFLADGQLGDDDLTANGSITDPGGPAYSVTNVSEDAIVSDATGGQSLRVYRTRGSPVGSITYVLGGHPPVILTNVRSFTFNGQGDDALTVTKSAGGPLVPRDIHFDGGGALIVDAAGSATRAGPGFITIGDPQNVTYANVGAITIDNAAAVNAMAGPDTADRATALSSLTDPTARFVEVLYLDELGRVGDTTSAKDAGSWVNALNSGTLTWADAASGIGHSAEARDHLVQSWYVAFLGRPAQGGEEQGWVNELLSGQAEEQVLSQILASPEFYTRAQTLIGAGTADENYVQALYLVLLDRTGEGAGVAGWVGGLPGLGQAGVALGFLQSQEFRTDQFEGYYNALLHRPDDAAGLNGWVFSNLNMDDVRIGFEAAPEFFTNG